MSPVFAPIAVAAGRLIAYCYVGPGASPTHEYRLYSLRSPPGHGRVVRFAPSLSIPGASLSPTLPVSVGAQWVEELGGGDGVHTTYSQAGSALFNLVSGAVLTPLPTLSAREYFDLSAPTVVRRLCAPVTTDNMPGADPLSAYSGWSTVVAFDRPWVVLERPDATLLAWRCGSPAPIRIGSDLPGHAQFATGILSWVAPDGSVDAENLANRRRLTWPARPTTSAATSIAYAEALHTAQRIFVVPQPFQGVPPTRAEPVYTASLGALYRR